MEATLSRGYALAPETDAEPDPADARQPPVLRSHWLGRVPYRRAWELQRRLAAGRADGRIHDQLLLLEHPAVLTLGRGADQSHVRASAHELARRGIEVLRVERGGEVTYHGPGQLVAYPILGLSRRGLLLRPLVRALEAALVDTCAAFGVLGARREGHPGCWCEPESSRPRKIGALGLRVERGVSFHGIALNVSVDLADFELIDACGLPGTISTSIDRELGRLRPPSTESVRAAALAFDRSLRAALASAPGATDDRIADPPAPPDGIDDPERALAALERLAAT